MIATLRSTRWRVPFGVALMLQPIIVVILLLSIQAQWPRGSDPGALRHSFWASVALGVFGSSWLSARPVGKLLGVIVYTPIAAGLLFLMVIILGCALGIDCM